MSEPDDVWNPEDGPEPTAEERAEARALAAALEGDVVSRPRTTDAESAAFLATALRVRATAHPDAEQSRAVARAAVDHALTRRVPPWYRGRWRWLATAAAVVAGVSGLHLLALRRPAEPVHSISQPVSDVFSAPLPDDARSVPIARMTDARLRAYRDAVLFAPRGRLP